MQGNSAMIPVWWWAYSGFYNPDSSTLTKDQVGFAGMPSYQGTTKTYAISMPFSISEYSEEPGRRMGIHEVAVEPRDGQGQRDRA